MENLQNNKPGTGRRIGQFLLKILVSSIAVYITSWLLPGVHVEQFYISILVALVLGLINTFLKPVLVYLTIPITIFSFGLFLLVINAGLVILVSRIVPGFTVDGFWWAVAFSIILSIINGLLNIPVREKQRQPGDEERS
jgi:putative membrane protein